MRARLASAINTEVYEIESANTEPPVQTFLQTGNILWCPIETMCASSDGTEPCTAESALGSILPERISAEATGLSSTKSEVAAESSIMMAA